LDTNLIKWLSKSKCSLLEGKEKNTIYGDYDDEGAKIKDMKRSKI